MSTTAAPLGRRRFLVTVLTAAGGLAVGVAMPGLAGAAPLDPAPWDRTAPSGAAEVNAWLLIEPDDRVTIRVAQSEMGEGVLVLFAADAAIRNNDVEHEYRQDSDFYYLTGFDEPESVLVLSTVHEQKFVLFVL